MWQNNLFWWISVIPIHNQSLIKCCGTPTGYYIDYQSCYYMPTRDSHFEYYDNFFNFIVYCAHGFVMTGIAKKLNPYSKELHADWIQCCRVGFGPHEGRPPPVTFAPSGAASYYAQRSDVPPLTALEGLYRSEYQKEKGLRKSGSLLANEGARGINVSSDEAEPFHKAFMDNLYQKTKPF